MPAEMVDRTDTLRISVEGPGRLDELLVARVRRVWHLQSTDLVRLDRASSEESADGTAWARLTVEIDRDGIHQRSRWECSGPLARALCEGADGRCMHAGQSRRFTLTLIDIADIARPAATSA